MVGDTEYRGGGPPERVSFFEVCERRGEGVWGNKPKGETVCFMCVKGVKFRSKLVCERTRDQTSERSLPVGNFFEPPGMEMGIIFAILLQLCWTLLT